MVRKKDTAPATLKNDLDGVTKLLNGVIDEADKNSQKAESHSERMDFNAFSIAAQQLLEFLQSGLVNATKEQYEAKVEALKLAANKLPFPYNLAAGACLKCLPSSDFLFDWILQAGKQ